MRCSSSLCSACTDSKRGRRVWYSSRDVPILIACPWHIPCPPTLTLSIFARNQAVALHWDVTVGLHDKTLNRASAVDPPPLVWWLDSWLRMHDVLSHFTPDSAGLFMGRRLGTARLLARFRPRIKLGIGNIDCIRATVKIRAVDVTRGIVGFFWAFDKMR